MSLKKRRSKKGKDKKKNNIITKARICEFRVIIRTSGRILIIIIALVTYTLTTITLTPPNTHTQQVLQELGVALVVVA